MRVNVRKLFQRRPDRYLTIKVISDTGASTRNYVIGRRAIRRAKIAGVAAIILLILGIVAMVDSVVSHRRIAYLEGRNYELETQSRNVAALKNELAEIWIINERLQRMLGAGRTEKAAQPKDRSLPWSSPLARWAGRPFELAPEQPNDGVYLNASPGTLVVATAPGLVREMRWDPRNGDVLHIDHGHGIQSVYGGNITLFAQPGERVVQGQTIGIVQDIDGSHTPKVLYRLLVDGSVVNPLVAMTGLPVESQVYPAELAY